MCACFCSPSLFICPSHLFRIKLTTALGECTYPWSTWQIYGHEKIVSRRDGPLLELEECVSSPQLTFYFGAEFVHAIMCRKSADCIHAVSLLLTSLLQTLRSFGETFPSFVLSRHLYLPIARLQVSGPCVRRLEDMRNDNLSSSVRVEGGAAAGTEALPWLSEDR